MLKTIFSSALFSCVETPHVTLHWFYKEPSQCASHRTTLRGPSTGPAWGILHSLLRLLGESTDVAPVRMLVFILSLVLPEMSLYTAEKSNAIHGPPPVLLPSTSTHRPFPKLWTFIHCFLLWYSLFILRGCRLPQSAVQSLTSGVGLIGLSLLSLTQLWGCRASLGALRATNFAFSIYFGWGIFLKGTFFYSQ